MAFRTHNNTRYVFMFWCHQDDKWKRCNKLFHLTNYENSVLTGQYITDMEFNVQIDDNKPKHFMVVGVKNKQTYMNLESEFNKQNDGNPNMSDVINLSLDLKFKEYFIINNEDWEKFKKNELKKNVSTTYTMYGYINSNNSLNLRFDEHEHYGIMCCLPSISIIV
tara:strand:+ start:540 stop:1034 length:495 start_codon:yes stop_codon:yes gene_type:complete